MDKQDNLFITKSLYCVYFYCVLMVLASKFVYGIWLGKGTIDINYSTTSLILLYISFEMLYKVYGTIINGTGKVFAQIILTGVIAIIIYRLQYFWANYLACLEC